MIGKIWGAITGTPKMVDNVFDKDNGLLTQVGQWAGHQQFTDEEKAKHNEEMAKNVRAFSIATLTENTDRSKARRCLAKKWFDMHVFFIKVNMLCIPVDHLAIKLGEQKGYELTTAVSSIAFDPWLCSITGGIGLFFWGTHSLRSSKFGKDD